MLRWHLPRLTIPALVVLVLSTLALVRPAAADVDNFRGIPSAFSPNGDGRRDVTTLRWNLTGGTADSITITIRKFISLPDTPPLRTFVLLSRPVGVDSVVWDGKDGLGAVLPDTLYAVRLTQTNLAGALVGEAAISIELDNTPPVVPVIAGAADTTVTEAVYAFNGFAVDADTVIVFRGGVPIDTVAAIGFIGAFTANSPLLEGDNQISIQAYDNAFNLSPQTTAISVRYLNTPGLGAARAIPSPFSPDGDGVLDTTRVVFTLDAPTTRLQVFVRGGAVPKDTSSVTFPVALVFDGPASPGQLTIPWDGRDSVGTIMPDGLYHFVVRAESLSVDGVPIPPESQRLAGVTLDNTAPAAPELLNPLPERWLRNTIVVDVHTVQTDTLFTWNNGTLVSTRISTGPSITSAIGVPLSLGDNDLTFQGKDTAGHSSPLAGPFRVRYETPIGFHASERFTRGDAFVINLEAPARSVVIDLFTLKGQPVRRLSSSQSLTRYELEWDLNDETGHGVGDGPYIAQLHVTFPDGTVQETRGAVVVVK